MEDFSGRLPLTGEYYLDMEWRSLYDPGDLVTRRVVLQQMGKIGEYLGASLEELLKGVTPYGSAISGGQTSIAVYVLEDLVAKYQEQLPWLKSHWFLGLWPLSDGSAVAVAESVPAETGQSEETVEIAAARLAVSNEFDAGRQAWEELADQVDWMKILRRITRGGDPSQDALFERFDLIHNSRCDRRGEVLAMFRRCGGIVTPADLAVGEELGRLLTCLNAREWEIISALLRLEHGLS